MGEDRDNELRRMGIAMNEIRINLDDRQFSVLQKRASKHGHTVEAELRDIVDTTLRSPMPGEEFVRRAGEIAAMTPASVKQTDSTLLVRQDRDSR